VLHDAVKRERFDAVLAELVFRYGMPPGG